MGNKTKKVNEFLEGKSRKSGTTKKVYVAA
jgi:hypothetical protein